MMLPAAYTAAGFVERLYNGRCSNPDGYGYMLIIPVTFLAASVLLLTGYSANAADAVPGPQRQRELVHLVRQECGFCHGLRLTGGLGSPLTASAMKDKPAETMVAVILYGIPGSAMPGWQPFLTQAEAVWIVDKLQEGFPNDNN